MIYQITQVLFIFQCNSLANGLMFTEAVIPSYAVVGEPVTLACSYQLEGDTLYSVKWFRDGQEFYRYIPSDNPHTRVFTYSGLNINEETSSPELIEIKSTTLTSG